MMVEKDNTPLEDVERMVTEVGQRAQEWKDDVSMKEKIALLQQIRINTQIYGEDWVRLSVQARSSSEPKSGVGDAIFCSTANLGNYLTGLISTFQRSSKKDSKSWRSLTPDKSAVQVYPHGVLEHLEGIGQLKGELVLSSSSNNNSDVTSDDDDDAKEGGLSCILGAGNFNSPVDVLTEMFVHHRVCVYKPNPVNALPFTCMENQILKPLIDAGYLAICHGGADVGAALTQASHKKRIVITGSASTYNAVVWGSTPDQQRLNKSNNTPVLSEEVTEDICAELGAVNAWIIVPGEQQWNNKMVDVYARHLACAKLTNHGHTCVSPQLYIVHPQWKYRQLFQQRLKHWLTVYPPSSPAFYPGTYDRQQLYQQLYPHQSQLLYHQKTNHDDTEEANQPLLFVSDLDMTKDDDTILQTEAFGPVLAEVPLPLNNNNGKDVMDDMEFLSQALEFVQTRVHGSLSMTILINDVLMKRNRETINQILATIPYGCVGINIWPALIHSMPRLAWGTSAGAFAEGQHRLELQSSSGQGWMGNAVGYSGVEKSILQAKFHCLPRRLFLVHKPQRQQLICQRLARYKLRPNLFTQALFVSALLLGL